MQNSPFKKLLLIILLLATGAALLLQFINSELKPQGNLPPLPPKNFKPNFVYHYATATRPAVTNQPAAESDDGENARVPSVSREKAEAWLTKYNRNAMSLLATFRALKDTNYLNEAATNFPNDPHVELAVLAHVEFPADRRKWLDLFKASSPSNSLANYLSAQDYFKNGKPDDAVRELLVAAGKGQFQNYAVETLLNGEEFYSDSGLSARETASYAMAGMAEENMSQLTDFRQISRAIGQSMKEKMAAGDTQSATDLARLGLDFSDKINSGDSGKFLINQMAGMAVERIILLQLEQNAAYDFLGGQTPAQVTEALKQQSAETRKLMADFAATQMQMLTSESETASYMQRMKIYGEIAAMQWLIQQHPSAVQRQ